MIDIKNQDCLKGLQSLDDCSVDCIITDPPYGMDFKSNRRKEQYGKITNDENLEWLPAFLSQAYRVLKDNTHFYMFCSFHNLETFIIEVKKNFQLKNVIVWEKNNTSMGDLEGDYAPVYEFVLFINKGRRALKGSRKRNLVKYAKTGNRYHSTEKPLELIRFLLRNSTVKGERVLDPFMGSGTTAVACKELGREFIGYEIDTAHFLTTQQRLKEVNKSLNVFA